MPENGLPPSPPAPPPPGPERPPRPLRSLESASNRLRRLLGLGAMPPKPTPGPPLTGVGGLVVKALGSFFGVGFLPLAPGTWGSLVALAIWMFAQRPLHDAGLTPSRVDVLCFLLSVGFFLATLALGKLAERAAGQYDPKWFVLDELGGAFLALYGLAGYNDRPVMTQLVLVASAFLLFRVLDATKLGMIGWVDRRMTGGLGILMDDLFAGAAANLTVRGLALLVVGRPLTGG